MYNCQSIKKSLFEKSLGVTHYGIYTSFVDNTQTFLYNKISFIIPFMFAINSTLWIYL